MSSVVNTSYEAKIRREPAKRLLVLYTDILDDIDDADALVVALQLLLERKYDRLIIITAGAGGHTARVVFCAFVVKEMLKLPQNTSIRNLPVLIYEGCTPGPGEGNYMDPEMTARGLEAIPTVQHGAQRIRNEVEAAGEVLLLVAAPVGRDLLALDLHEFPRVKACIMAGAFAAAFDGAKIDNHKFAEYNAAGNPQGLALLLQAFESRTLMCPLDSCANNTRVPYWGEVLPNVSSNFYQWAYHKWVASMKTKNKTKVLQGLRDGEASNIKFDLRALYDGLRWIGWIRRGIQVTPRIVSVLPGGQTTCQWFDSPAPPTTPLGSFSVAVSFLGCGYFQAWARKYLTAGSPSALEEKKDAATRVQALWRGVAVRAKKSESPKRERGSSDDSSSAAKKAEGEEGPSLKKARN